MIPLTLWLAAVTAVPVCPEPTTVDGRIFGTVVDVATKNPVPDVLVTITGPALEGGREVITDFLGRYEVPLLAPGTYEIRFEKEGFLPLHRDFVTVREGFSIRANVDLLPDAFAEPIVFNCKPPTVDVSSTSLGVNVSSEFVRSAAGLFGPRGSM